MKWSKAENVLWSAGLPGWGTNSPVVFGDRVFVTSHVAEGGKKSLLTLCFDRMTGKELWRHDFGFGVDQKAHANSDLPVNTPAVIAGDVPKRRAEQSRASPGIRATASAPAPSRRAVPAGGVEVLVPTRPRHHLERRRTPAPNVNLALAIVPESAQVSGYSAGAFQARDMAETLWVGFRALCLLNGFWILFSAQLANMGCLAWRSAASSTRPSRSPRPSVCSSGATERRVSP